MSGPKADRWLQRLAEGDPPEARKKGEGGDADAANRLSEWYYNGEKGLAVDFLKAFRWPKRSADLGQQPHIPPLLFTPFPPPRTPDR